MEKNKLRSLITISLVSLVLTTAQASTLECPPVDKIKNANFINVDYNQDAWEFGSLPFYDKSTEWSVLFVTELENKYPQDPFIDGRKAFEKAPIRFTHPKPTKLRFHFKACIYSHRPEDKMTIMAITPAYVRKN